jgi:hypothetical protein
MDSVFVEKIIKEAISIQLDIPITSLKLCDKIWLLGADYLDYIELISRIEEELEFHSKIRNDELGLLLDSIFALKNFSVGLLIQNISNHYKKSIYMKKIWVTFRKIGFHRFPKASNPEFHDVAYLKYEHRHLFYFKVSINVLHNDRDIEFHQFLNWLESLYNTGVLQLDDKSCEMLCDDLRDKIHEKYPNRHLVIEISEDGECGAECHYQPVVVKHNLPVNKESPIASDSEWLQA